MSTFNEYGKDMQENTGEHVHYGLLDFDVWAYRRVGSGYTVCGRQMPPQPMLDAAGTADLPAQFWTVNIGGRSPLTGAPLTTFLPFCEADDDAPRIPFVELPAEVQRIVVAQAGEGWVWSDQEWRYDATADRWVVAETEEVQ